MGDLRGSWFLVLFTLRVCIVSPSTFLSNPHLNCIKPGEERSQQWAAEKGAHTLCPSYWWGIRGFLGWGWGLHPALAVSLQKNTERLAKLKTFINVSTCSPSGGRLQTPFLSFVVRGTGSKGDASLPPIKMAPLEALAAHWPPPHCGFAAEAALISQLASTD